MGGSNLAVEGYDERAIAREPHGRRVRRCIWLGLNLGGGGSNEQLEPPLLTGMEDMASKADKMDAATYRIQNAQLNLIFGHCAKVLSRYGCPRLYTRHFNCYKNIASGHIKVKKTLVMYFTWPVSVTLLTVYYKCIKDT